MPHFLNHVDAGRSSARHGIQGVLLLHEVTHVGNVDAHLKVTCVGTDGTVTCGTVDNPPAPRDGLQPSLTFLQQLTVGKPLAGQSVVQVSGSGGVNREDAVLPKAEPTTWELCERRDKGKGRCQQALRSHRSAETVESQAVFTGQMANCRCRQDFQDQDQDQTA